MRVFFKASRSGLHAAKRTPRAQHSPPTHLQQLISQRPQRGTRLHQRLPLLLQAGGHKLSQPLRLLQIGQLEGRAAWRRRQRGAARGGRAAGRLQRGQQRRGGAGAGAALRLQLRQQRLIAQVAVPVLVHGLWFGGREGTEDGR